MLDTVEKIDNWFELMIDGDGERMRLFWMCDRLMFELDRLIRHLDAILFSMDEREHLALIDYFVSRCYAIKLHATSIRRIREAITPLQSDRVFPAYINLFVKKHTLTQEK